MRLISFKIIILLCLLFLCPGVIYASRIFTVQAGAFSSKTNAQNLIAVLQSYGIRCSAYDQKGLSKVHCGKFSTRSKADILRKKLFSLGFDAFVLLKIMRNSQGSRKANIQAEQLFPPVASTPKVVPLAEDKSQPKLQAKKQEVILASQTPVLFNRIVAVVNKDVITWSELYKAMEFQAGTQIKNLSADEQKKLLKRSAASFLESLIDAQLQLQEAQKLGLKTTQRELTEAIETVKKKYSMTQAYFIETLKKEGLTFDGYKKRLSEEILISKVVASEIRNKIIISDDEVMKYMEDHKVNSSSIVGYRLRQIFLRKPMDGNVKTVEEKAALIMKRLRDGEDFSALAWVYSDDLSRKVGGDLGLVSRDLLAREFVDVLSSMKVGDYSKPFWTEKGLHIIKLENIVSSANADEVRDNVRNKLAEHRFTKRYKNWIKSLREKAYIEVRL